MGPMRVVLFGQRHLFTARTPTLTAQLGRSPVECALDVLALPRPPGRERRCTAAGSLSRAWGAVDGVQLKTSGRLGSRT